MRDLVEPGNVSEARAFLGLMNYYGRFVKNLARILSPIYNLLQKGTKFHWSEDCQKAFERAKEKVSVGQVLVHFNPQTPIKLYYDNRLGAILVHVYPNGEEKPIGFTSRLLAKSEKNYSVIHKEALAIYWAVCKFYQYLMGNKFVLVTDHRPLLALFGGKKGIPEMAAGHIQRWAFYLSGFDFSENP